MEHRGESPSPPPLKKRKRESTTTNNAVHKFFTPISKKAPEPLTWRVIHDSLLIGQYSPMPDGDKSVGGSDKRRKIALFDLDSTLVSNPSGNIYSKDANDWKWWHISVSSNLKQLYADGYHIAIITNQGRLSLRPEPKTAKSDQRLLSTFKTKVTAILSHFDFPITILAATARDTYRKPRTGMWNELLDELDLDGTVKHGAQRIVVSLDDCFFVGDAGGRAGTADRKADHACSDRDFASNIGMKFLTPEEHFLKEEPGPFTRHFEPANFLLEEGGGGTDTDATPIVFEKKHPLDIVVMCGSPGSGKSTFYATKLKPLGYGRVNQDTLKTRDKCVAAARKMLGEGTSVAVDNTNADMEVRAVWVALARDKDLPIRCVWFAASAKVCEHNDTVRALAGEKGGYFNPEKRTILPHSAFAGFKNRFRPPRVEEGFVDVVKEEFVFRGDEEARKVWGRYWV